jgi:hypothetical protein
MGVCATAVGLVNDLGENNIQCQRATALMMSKSRGRTSCSLSAMLLASHA